MQSRVDDSMLDTHCHIHNYRLKQNKGEFMYCVHIVVSHIQ